jgi:hypothetical protein
MRLVLGPRGLECALILNLSPATWEVRALSADSAIHRLSSVTESGRLQAAECHGATKRHTGSTQRTAV